MSHTDARYSFEEIAPLDAGDAVDDVLGLAVERGVDVTCEVVKDVDFTLVQVSMNGQILQLLHFFMPGFILVGLLGARGGTLALTILSFMLGGRLYATNGRRG